MNKYVIETTEARYEIEADYYTIDGDILTFYDRDYLKDKFISFYNMRFVVAVWEKDEEESEEEK